MSQVCAISIYVKDLDEAAEFYTHVLGLKVKVKMPYLIVLEHEGTDLVLCQAEKPAAGNYPEGSAVVLGFKTDNLAQSIKHFQSRKVSLIHQTPQDFPQGQFIAFRDPSGNVHELLEFKR